MSSDLYFIRYYPNHKDIEERSRQGYSLGEAQVRAKQWANDNMGPCTIEHHSIREVGTYKKSVEFIPATK
jgi:hypothetical protein